MEREKRKIWVTKYALTQGIFIAEAETTDELVDGKAVDQGWDGMIAVRPDNKVAMVPAYYYPGKDAFYSYEEAAQAANKMRTKKIAALHKQISKLEKMRF